MLVKYLGRGVTAGYNTHGDCDGCADTLSHCVEGLAVLCGVLELIPSRPGDLYTSPTQGRRADNIQSGTIHQEAAVTNTCSSAYIKGQRKVMEKRCLKTQTKVMIYL